MRLYVRYFWLWFGISLAVNMNILQAGTQITSSAANATPFGAARRIGLVESDRLVECSGMDVSMAHDDLLWAINDRGNKPFLFAMGADGRDRGRVRVDKAENRDWEGIPFCGRATR